MNQAQIKSNNNNTPKRRAKPTAKTAEQSPTDSPYNVFMRKMERFGWDLVGLSLLTSGALLFLGVFGITKGSLLDQAVAYLNHWFGWGQYLLPIIAFASGWMLLLWRKGEGQRIKLGHIVLLELTFFAILAAISSFSMDTVFHVEQQESYGGLIGWGLARPLTAILGWPIPGIIFSVLALIFALGGFNMLGRVERWAAGKAGIELREKSVSADFTPLQPETSVEPDKTVKNTAAPPSVVNHSARVEPKHKDSLSRKNHDQPGLPGFFGKVKAVDQPAAQKAKVVKRPMDLPPLTLLDEEKVISANQATINMNAGLLEKTLAEFGIPAKVVGYRVGPTVTQYAVEPGYVEKGSSGGELQKVRIAQISALNKDLALALKAERLRIEAPVPGKSYVGIEVPNATHTIVRLRPMLESENFARVNSPLAIPLGRDVSGQPIISDLSTMPHLLIAGTTNSGKSICIAAITTCLVMNNSPEDLKLVMIDPKMVELNRFNGLPHLLGQVETNVERIMSVLRWATTEMDFRYKLLETVRARNLDSYNTKMERSGKVKLPRVVIMIDELADLMMSAPEATETALVRLAQKARAVGMHLIVATQRPSTDIVTGLIKANFPTRIAFTVASSVDSRVILDTNGAETLLGKGDMLFLHPEVGIPQRSQGVLVSDTELERVLRWWKEHSVEEKVQLPLTEAAAVQENVEEPEAVIETPSVREAQPEPTGIIEEEAPWEATVQTDMENTGDEGLIRQAIELLRKDKRASASYMQRQLRIGYPKAAWLIDTLEARGILGPAKSGGREREIMLPDETTE